MPIRLVLLFCLITCALAPAIADQRSETLHQIELAKKEVTELKNALNSLNKQRSSAQRSLRQTELKIASFEKKIATIKKELKSLESELTQLNADKEKTQTHLKEQEKLFATQAKATYENGRQEYIKLLLNQQNPEKISRLLAYYDYLSQARLEQLSLFADTLKQLKQIEDTIAQSKQKLDAQNTELQTQKQSLSVTRKKRARILASINKKIKDKNNRISAREQDQKELNNVLKTIDQTLTQQAEHRKTYNTKNNQKSDAPTYVSTVGQQVTGSFINAKGKLPWPVNGKVIAQFGSTRGSDNRSKWDGTLISTARGTPVKTIFSGKVVYADWLKGVGLLVIVDHGQGYYSLYGHNQQLSKSVGDYVKAGDVLATVGNTGGLDVPALYFSIRKKGLAVNPALWCKAL